MIATPRLSLEQLTLSHADLLFPGLSDPALYTFIPADPPSSLDEKREHFARILRGPRDNDEELWLNWAARVSATGEYIGYIETSTFPGDYAHLAYFIFAGAQRKGYAREACEHVIRHVERAHRIRLVVAEMDTRNVASWRLAESLGFARVGEKRDADFFKGETSHEYRYELNVTRLIQASRGT
ncbi:MAG: GNAT family N-acetyltransferase [Betaproteobacteria bacterium]|nr:GNAT family N-acetyltransferase [Betaproteobacteria bacterium]